MKAGILYVVATPIGNRKDITFRAVDILKKVDAIVCEDTRTTKKLLDFYDIKTETISFYQNLKKGGAIKPGPKVEIVIQKLQEGKNLAFVTDAGTPGIADPGNQLVERAIEGGIAVIPIPGVSSVTTLISVSGIDASSFVFLGFPPHKKGRETFFKKMLEISMPVVYFESPHRVLKNLEFLQKLLDEKQEKEKRIILGRELTKMFEEVGRGKIENILDYFQKNPQKIKGEFVIIVY